VNLPNAITVSRLVVTAGVFLCLEWAWRVAPAAAGSVVHGATVSEAAGNQMSTLMWVAFWLFLLAAFTDFLDGYLARKFGQVTAFGRVADPFADKILVTGTFVLLLRFPAATEAWLLTGWYVVVVLAREFLVTAVRGLVESSGQAFPADRLGKWKMVTQCWTCGALMTLVAGIRTYYECALAGIWVSLTLTVVSGVGYVWKARKVLFA